jgi:hypothetical protein
MNRITLSHPWHSIRLTTLLASFILMAISFPSTVVAQKSDAPQPALAKGAPPALTNDEMTVPDNLSFEQKVKRHVIIVSKASAIRAWSLKKRNEVLTANGTARDYAFFDDEYSNANKVLLPYSVANEQASALRKKSYVLNVSAGNVCIKGTQCQPIDPITGTMMFYQEVAEGKKKPNTSSVAPPDEEQYTTVTCGTTQIKIQGQDVCIIIDFLRDKPLDVITFGVLPAVRDAIIPPDDKGEIARFVRDPLKRPIEVVQEWRDSVIPKNDNGEGAKIIRDPIKCTAGRLFGQCK